MLPAVLGLCQHLLDSRTVQYYTTQPAMAVMLTALLSAHNKEVLLQNSGKV